MAEQKEFPKVGIGIIILNKDGKVLVGKRKGSHAQFYSIPGGHLEIGETFEEAAIREAKEETGLNIKFPTVFCVTNNLETYKKEGKHYISVALFVTDFSGILENREQAKCDGWLWVDPKNLPQPHFDASQREVDCYLTGKFYKKYE